MSKAFTNEEDGGDALIPRPELPLPPGAKNYLTPAGLRTLHDERARLAEVERPALLTRTGVPGAVGAEAKARLQEVETRLAYVEESLRRAEVPAVPPLPHDTVRFGAAVTVRDPKGRETVYRIVGADEADYSRDEVSWVSPIARALLNARLGGKVMFRFPAGMTELEVVRISYS